MLSLFPAGAEEVGGRVRRFHSPSGGGDAPWGFRGSIEGVFWYVRFRVEGVGDGGERE